MTQRGEATPKERALQSARAERWPPATGLTEAFSGWLSGWEPDGGHLHRSSGRIAHRGPHRALGPLCGGAGARLSLNVACILGASAGTLKGEDHGGTPFLSRSVLRWCPARKIPPLTRLSCCREAHEKGSEEVIESEARLATWRADSDLGPPCREAIRLLMRSWMPTSRARMTTWPACRPGDVPSVGSW